MTSSDHHLVYLPGRGRVSHLLHPWESPICQTCLDRAVNSGASVEVLSL